MNERANDHEEINRRNSRKKIIFLINNTVQVKTSIKEKKIRLYKALNRCIVRWRKNVNNIWEENIEEEPEKKTENNEYERRTNVEPRKMFNEFDIVGILKST